MLLYLLQTMNKKHLLILIFFVAPLAGFSQTSWTLEECINYALENNITVKQSEAQLTISSNNLTQSKMEMLPAISGSASHNYNFGRSIDPFTNTFATQQIRSNNFSVTGNITLFNGLQNQNTIKQRKAEKKAAKEDLEATKNNIALNIANAFLQVVLNEEVVAINKEQVKTTEQQLERTKKLVEAGRSAINAELDIKAQLASEKLNLVNAENQLKLSYLTLWQLMLKEPNNEDRIVKPGLSQDFDNLLPYAAANVYNNFAADAPEINAAKKRIISSNYAYKVAQGGRSPRIALNGSVSTLYSESFKNVGGFVTLGTREVYTDLNGNPVVIPYQVPTTSEVTPFGEQLNNNLGRFIGVGMTIPIFSRWQINTAIKNAKTNVKVAELNFRQAENNLFREVTTAVNEYDAARARYTSAKENLDAQKKSFEFAEARNKAGLMNFAEFALIKNNYTRAEITLAQAQYELLFRMKTIEFYNTGKITN